MNNILIIDSTSAKLRLGVIVDSVLKSIEFASQLKKHNSVLLPMIEDLLLGNNMTIHDIDAIACVVGPGSFTGIRLGVATANGLAAGLNIPRISINSLQPMAYGKAGKVLAAIDANHGNYYCGIYNDGAEVRLDNMTAAEVNSFDGAVVLEGDSTIESVAKIASAKLMRQDFTPQLQPLYLKLSQAEREANENNKG